MKLSCPHQIMQKKLSMHPLLSMSLERNSLSNLPDPMLASWRQKSRGWSLSGQELTWSTSAIYAPGGAPVGLKDAHVDRAQARQTPFTARFQDFISRYAWGEIWTDPTLARRERSMITLTALVAHGHYDELAMHVRAARRNGLTPEEIGAVLLQTAVYCGVPAANSAFAVAQRVLAEEEGGAQQ